MYIGLIVHRVERGLEDIRSRNPINIYIYIYAQVLKLHE